MSDEPRTPPRWLDKPPTELPSHFLRELEGYERGGPGADWQQNMWQQLEGALVPGAPVAKHVWRWPLAGLGALLLTLSAVLVGRSAQPGLRPAPLVAAAASVGAKPPPTAATDPRQPSAATIAAAAPVVGQAAASAQSRGRAKVADAPGSLATTKKPAGASTAAAGPSAASELSLLMRARKSVRAQPERALQLTEEHRQQFAHGIFAEERELLAIEALTRLGRHSLVRERAQHFRVQYPGSTHRFQVDELTSKR